MADQASGQRMPDGGDAEQVADLAFEPPSWERQVCQGGYGGVVAWHPQQQLVALPDRAQEDVDDPEAFRVNGWRVVGGRDQR